MHILKKILDYVVGALRIGVACLIIYGAVMAIMRVAGTIARGEPLALTTRFKHYIFYVSLLAAIAAYVKLRRKYRGENK
jgi:hypothetical protein